MSTSWAPKVRTDLSQSAARKSRDLLSAGPPHWHDDRRATDFAPSSSAEPELVSMACAPRRNMALRSKLTGAGRHFPERIVTGLNAHAKRGANWTIPGYLLYLCGRSAVAFRCRSPGRRASTEDSRSGREFILGRLDFRKCAGVLSQQR